MRQARRILPISALGALLGTTGCGDLSQAPGQSVVMSQGEPADLANPMALTSSWLPPAKGGQVGPLLLSGSCNLQNLYAADPVVWSSQQESKVDSVLAGWNIKNKGTQPLGLKVVEVSVADALTQEVYKAYTPSELGFEATELLTPGSAMHMDFGTSKNYSAAPFLLQFPAPPADTFVVL